MPGMMMVYFLFYARNSSMLDHLQHFYLTYIFNASTSAPCYRFTPRHHY